MDDGLVKRHKITQILKSRQFTRILTSSSKKDLEAKERLRSISIRSFSLHRFISYVFHVFVDCVGLIKVLMMARYYADADYIRTETFGKEWDQLVDPNHPRFHIVIKVFFSFVLTDFDRLQ